MLEEQLCSLIAFSALHGVCNVCIILLLDEVARFARIFICKLQPYMGCQMSVNKSREK